MLFNFETGKPVTTMPHEKEYINWCSQLSSNEFNIICEELESMIDKDEIHTSSWMPGNKWAGTVFYPIYQKACGQNETDSGLFFGLIVWDVFRKRNDEWYFGRFENNGNLINGITYFRKNN